MKKIYKKQNKKLTMTRFTSETALRLTPQKYIRPAISTIIINIVTTITNAEQISNPISTVVTKNIVSSDMPIDLTVSYHMVRYCS